MTRKSYALPKKRETAENEGRKGEKEGERGREKERNGGNRRGRWRGIATSTRSLSAVQAYSRGKSHPGLLPYKGLRSTVILPIQSGDEKFTKKIFPELGTWQTQLQEIPKENADCTRGEFVIRVYKTEGK